MRTVDLTEKIIKFGDEIKYVPRTHDYGRAEFTICPVFKRGIIRELYIYPRQQPDAKHFYKLVPMGKYRIIDFTYYGGDFNDCCRIWQTWWCKEHKCFSLEFYVPNEGDSFKVNCHFGDTISLEWCREFREWL